MANAHVEVLREVKDILKQEYPKGIIFNEKSFAPKSISLSNPDVGENEKEPNFKVKSDLSKKLPGTVEAVSDYIGTNWTGVEQLISGVSVKGFRVPLPNVSTAVVKVGAGSVLVIVKDSVEEYIQQKYLELIEDLPVDGYNAKVQLKGRVSTVGLSEAMLEGLRQDFKKGHINIDAVVHNTLAKSYKLSPEYLPLFAVFGDEDSMTFRAGKETFSGNGFDADDANVQKEALAYIGSKGYTDSVMTYSVGIKLSFK